MSNLRAVLAVSGLALVTVGVLSYPYVKARLTHVDSIVAMPSSVTDGSEPWWVQLGAHTLAIPDLGISAPIVQSEGTTEADYQQALKHGVVQFPDTPGVGELGNMYIFGHSSDFVWATGEYKTIFAKLPEIEIGTKIFVTDAEGRAFTYEVIETKIVGPRDFSVLDQRDYTERLLTLQTSYPLGTALQRYIVVARLLEL